MNPLDQFTKNRLTLTIGILGGLFVVGAFVIAAFASNPAAALSSVLPTTFMPKDFSYTFNQNGKLEEVPSPNDSSSPYFWLDSGGELLIQNGIGKTMEGNAPPGNHWRELYAKNNPQDSDYGSHPQNLFRLVTKDQFENTREELYFKINADNVSESSNRNESNGLFFMNRYTDKGQTLYYAGLRVDGTAVIKKKFKKSSDTEGKYYTMAQQPLFAGTYDRFKKPDLIPHNEWIGLAAETTTNSDGSVTIQFYVKREKDSDWKLVLNATDTGQYEGTKPITGSHFLGVRTDFMDIAFQNFKIETL